MLIRFIVGIAFALSSVSAVAQDHASQRDVIEKAADLIEARYVNPLAGKRSASDLRLHAATALPVETPVVFAKN